MSTPASAATGVRQQTINTIAEALAKTEGRIAAIQRGEAQGNVDALFEVQKVLLQRLQQAFILRFNALNDSQETRDAIAGLKDGSARAKSEARNIKEITDDVDAFTRIVNRVTGVVGGLVDLLT